MNDKVTTRLRSRITTDGIEPSAAEPTPRESGGRLVLRCPLVVIILPVSVSLRGRGIGTFPPPEQRAPPKFKREWPRCLTTTREHGPV